MKIPVPEILSLSPIYIDMIFVCGPKDKVPTGSTLVDVTSHSSEFTRGLSPFILGPIKLYGNYIAKNVENAWQYSKVYKIHTQNGEPTPEYFKWATEGWDNGWAVRYPMGKGAIPEYCLWEGEKLGYIQARKRVYIPLYSKAVLESDSYPKLVELYKNLSSQGKDLWLWDFDGYNHRKLSMSLEDVFNCEDKKAGHGFVLMQLLEKEKINLSSLELSV